MNMSNSDEIKSSENQQLPTFKDPKGCLDITPNYQKDDGDKKIVILHQDPKGCQDITIKDDDDDKKLTFLHQDPKGCQDFIMDDQKVANDKKIVILQQESKGCHDIPSGQQKDDDTNKTQILHQDPKGCQDITMDHQKDDDTNKIVILHQDPNGCQGDIAQNRRREEGVINEALVQQSDDNEVVLEDDIVNEAVVQQPVENEVVPEDDDDGFRTPTSLESRIPILTTCPPAPKVKRSGTKRKASPPRRGQRTIRVWIECHHRDSGRFWPEY
ncbi:unnamed protein product [Withania somnifera]